MNLPLGRDEKPKYPSSNPIEAEHSAPALQLHRVRPAKPTLTLGLECGVCGLRVSARRLGGAADGVR